jgi:Tol biopolymer transport system component
MRVAGETYNLWTINAGGGEEKQLTTDGLPPVENTILPYNRTQTSSFSWSPDGKKIAYVSDSEQRNVWLVDADGANSTQLTNNTDSTLFLDCPIWSSDGKRIIYSSKLNKPSADKKTLYSTFVIDLETKNTKAVAQSEIFQRLLGWSQSDEEIILAAVNSKNRIGLPTEVSIIEVNIETGKQKQLFKLEAAYLYNIYLSSDKKMIAYTSNKDGKDNIWVARLNGGEARKITSNNDARLYSSTLSWSPDNRTIYFGKQTRYSLLSMVTNIK